MFWVNLTPGKRKKTQFSKFRGMLFVKQNINISQEHITGIYFPKKVNPIPVCHLFLSWTHPQWVTSRATQTTICFSFLFRALAFALRFQRSQKLQRYFLWILALGLIWSCRYVCSLYEVVSSECHQRLGVTLFWLNMTRSMNCALRLRVSGLYKSFGITALIFAGISRSFAYCMSSIALQHSRKKRAWLVEIWRPQAFNERPAEISPANFMLGVVD